MISSVPARRVDYAAIRVDQVFVIVLLLLAFAMDSLLLAGLVSLIMLVSAAFPRLAPFQEFYHRLLKPANLVRPQVVVDNPEPHRFAQGLSGILAGLGALALAFGWILPGWTLTWTAVAMAGANLCLGFCAGSFAYYQLNRLGVPGFRYSPVQRGRR